MRIKEYWSEILIVFFGIISGISTQFNRLSNYEEIENFTNPDICLKILPGALFFSLLLFLIRKVLVRIIFKSQLSSSVKINYLRYDVITYGVFLLPLLGAFGVQFTMQLILLIIFSFFSLQFFLIYLFINRERKLILSPHWLSFLFLFSGFAAIIYQIVWQRNLFTIFGVNIESITIIVSIFMFGLGIGSIVGGLLSKKYESLLPQLFLMCEILIGLFGLISLPLIKGVGNITLHSSLFTISLTTYGLLFFPTLLMGATLPILVTYLNSYLKNIGVSVGTLYSINTIGSAIACFVTAEILFVLFGQQTTVYIAAILNFLVGSLVYIYIKKLPKINNVTSTDEIQILSNPSKKDIIRFLIVLALSAITGYISLSQEIIWIRAISYVTGGKPDVFAHVLGFFLFGIAFGAVFATKICEQNKIYPINFIAFMLFLSSIFYYFSIPLISYFITFFEQGMMMFYISIAISAFLIGGIFPVLCHFGIKQASSVGLSLSWIYFANIIGATAGPLFTGFVLLDILSLEKNILFLSVITLIFSGIIFSITSHSLKTKVSSIASVLISILIIFVVQNDIYSRLFERLHYKTEYQNKKPYKNLIENRVGIISVEEGLTDIIYGGGVYDGQFNVDPVLNTNRITRAYMVAALHPKPEEILEIGLSGGSWTWALASYKDLKRLTVVEINPGYIDLIKNYPIQATILNNPKIDIHIDDGRRWLNRNPDAKFDVIVMNTTFHWRSQATNLLSEEFLKICKNHLKPGGIIYYNTTWSDDVIFTAAKVFKHVVRYDNFVAASDAPFEMSYEEKIRNLLKFENNGKAIFDITEPDKNLLLHEMASYKLHDIANEMRKRKELLSITDDNMATEFKRINNIHKWHEFYNPKRGWLKYLKKRSN